ncbi:hypothetical protein MTP99_002980 [Tenebrio molitor]|nr:hypothetical protein MTP99_002980 [Tenebrio molitor]
MWNKVDKTKVEEQPVNKEVELSQEEVINFLRKYKEAGCKSVLHSILELFISEAKRNMFTELYKDENQKLSLEELPTIADTVTFKMSEEEAVQLEKKTVEQICSDVVPVEVNALQRCSVHVHVRLCQLFLFWWKLMNCADQWTVVCGF